jgi:hypothetical protein
MSMNETTSVWADLTLNWQPCFKITPTCARQCTQMDYDVRGGSIQTHEGPALFAPGDYLAQDALGEYPISCATIKSQYLQQTACDLQGWALYQSMEQREAVQMAEPFPTDRGVVGQPGDYLLRGADGRTWPCARTKFEQDYCFLPPVLPCLVPPMLERAIGYQGNARLVGLSVDLGDEVSFSDGDIHMCGEWDAYDFYVHHPLIAPHLRPFHLGSSMEPPIHALLVDRVSRTVAAVPFGDAQRLLRAQWGTAAPESAEMLVVSKGAWDALVEELMTRMQRSPVQLAEEWRVHQPLVQALIGWFAEVWEDAG